MVSRLLLNFALCLPLVCGMMGCSPDSGDLLSFRDYPAFFTARFPSSDGENAEVVCDAVLQNGEAVFTIAEPERSAGIVITCSADSCTVEAEGAVIPMSAEAAASLRGFVLVLTAGTEGELPQRSSDGGSTVLRFCDGTLTLDENLLPCAVICEGMNGDERRVILENYTLIKENPDT